MTDATCYFFYGHETPLGKRMALQAYMHPALQGAGHKASAQQIQECGGILSVLLQEKKEESFKAEMINPHQGYP